MPTIGGGYSALPSDGPEPTIVETSPDPNTTGGATSSGPGTSTDGSGGYTGSDRGAFTDQRDDLLGAIGSGNLAEDNESNTVITGQGSGGANTTGETVGMDVVASPTTPIEDLDVDTYANGGELPESDDSGPASGVSGIVLAAVVTVIVGAIAAAAGLGGGGS